ncbi:hypothetical protein CLAVI_000945 [Candidatus Clavichlamydia salmonicola]|uniref:hypothetical protein n=1 Tax=Candidatus Clavichlamydia salmonicola TaxID=469812 RepID=UPI001891B62D|nr:hypothetical protein [Candidatus Clavichlamydia salmonicola]MBF5051304.1 hypothetical protein [Candidatus Clavichlamydia salmonicola]
MTRVGSGFSSGIQFLNENLFVHTGRSCPSSWSELKANVSNNIKTCANNIKTCAKMWSAFLDSSLGGAISMSVLGLATASVCMQENLIEAMATTLLPITVPLSTSLPLDDEKVLVCFSKIDYTAATKYNGAPQWSGENYGRCNTPTTKDKIDEVHCVVVSAFKKRFPQMQFPSCPALSKSGYQSQGLYTQDDFLGAVFIFWSNGLWLLSKEVVCMLQSVSYSIGVGNQNRDFDLKLTSAKCTFSAISRNVSTNAICWNQKDDMRSKYPKAFIPSDQCVDPSHPTTASPHMTMTPSIHIEENICSSCSSMLLVFGVGSALVLMATLVKIIYKQCKKTNRIRYKNSDDRFGKFLILSIQEGLLLGASEVGCGVLVSSVRDLCSPVSKDAKQVLGLSTALYIASAATRLLGNCITSPVEEDEDGLIDSVVVVLDSPE